MLPVTDGSFPRFLFSASKYTIMKNIYFLILLLSVSCCFGCSSADDGQKTQAPVEIPTPDELTSIQVGLVAYYTFDDGTGNDNSPHGCHATLINHPDLISNTPSGKGKAISLEKQKGQYINIPYQLFKNTTYSVSMWIKDFGPAILFSAVNINKAYDYPCLAARTAGGKFELYSNNRGNPGPDYSFSYPFSALQDGNWHMIAVTHIPRGDGFSCEKRLYVDGKFVANCEGVYDVPSSIKVQIGGDCDGHYTSFSQNMKLDNVRFYDRVLDMEEITVIYNLERLQ